MGAFGSRLSARVSTPTRSRWRAMAWPAWSELPVFGLLGLLVGSLDLAFAIGYWVVRDLPPERVVQAMAGWVLGRDAAFAGGWRTALLGTALHYGLMVSVAMGYRLAADRYAVLRRRPVLAGAAYGAGCYVLVHVIAVPLSAGPPPPLPLDWQLTCLAVYVALIGIPCGALTQAASTSAAALSIRCAAAPNGAARLKPFPQRLPADAIGSHEGGRIGTAHRAFRSLGSRPEVPRLPGAGSHE